MRRRVGVMLALISSAALLMACDEEKPTTSTAPKSFTYTVTDSAGHLQVDRRIVVINGPVSGTCSSGVLTGIRHSGDALVTAPGVVTVSFTLRMSGAYVESLYIDVDASNTLSAGDLVWGINPYDLAGFCIAGMGGWPSVQSFDWTDDVAAIIGSVEYVGTTYPFGESLAPSLGAWWPIGSDGY